MVVDMCSLGTLRPEATFATRESLYPEGFTTKWKSPEGYEFTSTIVAAAAEDGVAPFPVFRVSVKPPRSNPFAAHPGKVAVAQSERDPDSVWREVFALQKIALELNDSPVPAPDAQPDGAAPEATAPVVADQADAARREALQARPQLRAALAAATLPPVHWGTLLFGFADVRTHQLLEAQPGASGAQQYTTLQVRPSDAQLSTWRQTPAQDQVAVYIRDRPCAGC